MATKHRSTPTPTPARPRERRLLLKTTVDPSQDEHALTRAIHGAVCAALRDGGVVRIEIFGEVVG